MPYQTPSPIFRQTFQEMLSCQPKQRLKINFLLHLHNLLHGQVQIQLKQVFISLSLWKERRKRTIAYVHAMQCFKLFLKCQNKKFLYLAEKGNSQCFNSLSGPRSEYMNYRKMATAVLLRVTLPPFSPACAVSRWLTHSLGGFSSVVFTFGLLSLCCICSYKLLLKSNPGRIHAARAKQKVLLSSQHNVSQQLRKQVG